MARPPKLTAEQLKQLAKLEPALRASVRAGDCNRSKQITGQIHHLLKSTGHDVRLLKSKNWYFECVMECGDLEKAAKAFDQIRIRAPRNTRVWLEASTLLAICYLRQAKWTLAELHINEVLRNDEVIRTPSRRAEFRRNSIARFAEETLLSASRTFTAETLEIEDVQKEAEQLSKLNAASGLLMILGEAVPKEGIAVLLRIDTFSKKLLPHNEAKLLRSPQQQTESAEVGRTFFESAKRVIWKSLCDSDSEVYKAWFDHGLKRVMGKWYIGAAVCQALSQTGLGSKAIAVTLTAIIIKLGVEIYCDRFKPLGTMIDHQ